MWLDAGRRDAPPAVDAATTVHTQRPRCCIDDFAESVTHYTLSRSHLETTRRVRSKPTRNSSPG
jgi:hypothetical protein